KFKVVVAPVFAVALLLCAGCPLAVTVTVYVPTGIQMELYPPVELVVVFTVVLMEPPMMVIAAPATALPLDRVTGPAILPPIDIAKWGVRMAREVTVADLVTAKYPVWVEVTL